VTAGLTEGVAPAGPHLHVDTGKVCPSFLEGRHRREASPEDLARSIMAMVGENVALLAGSFSLVVGVESIVFGGSTLRGNPALSDALTDYVSRFGRKPIFLDDGAFAGALGARQVAAEG